MGEASQSDASTSLRSAREAFLGQGRILKQVRAEIAASWRRSRGSGVSPETVISCHNDAFDWKSRLYRAASPVLEHYANRIAGARSSLVLADRHGRVLERWVGERDLASRLDKGSVARGFALSEEIAGTNGIGTVLELSQPMIIIGSEHYAAVFAELTCAGAPIRHPITRRIAGVIDLAVPAEDSNGLLLPIVTGIAEDVEHQLYLDASVHERVLLDSFVRTTRRTRIPVLSIDRQIMLANAAAANLLEGVEHALLWEQATQIVARKREQVGELTLRDGRVLQAHFWPIVEGNALVGVVIEIETDSVRRPTRPPPAPSRFAPTLVGRSSPWMHVLALAQRCAAASVPLLITGEPGVGKLEIARLVHRAASDDQELTICDAALAAVSGYRNWLQTIQRRLEHPEGTLLIRHLDALTAPARRALASVLEPAAAGGTPRLIATMAIASARQPQEHWPLLDLFVARIAIPPLRERREDIPDLIAAFIRKYADAAGQARSCHSEALQMLLRFDWPGNARQLDAAIRGIMTSGTGEIRLEDIPLELRRRSSRRALTRLEQTELDEIQAALAEAEGNKRKAAQILGISRTSLYNKLESYGINGL